MSKYLSKEIILAAYKRMKDLTEEPDKQGQTQTVSVVRHTVALDAFGQIMNRNCDTAETKDKKIFSDLVGDVVRIVKDIYTTNFYKDLKKSNDFNTGSNFYSAGVVAISRDNPEQIYSYPRRGNMPELFDVKNRTLLKDSIKHLNIQSYLHNPTLRCAFIVWLLREAGFSESACNDTFNFELKEAFENSHYSDALKDVLWSKDYWVPDYLISNTVEVFSSKPSQINEQDIYDLWLRSDHSNESFGKGISPIEFPSSKNLNIVYHDGSPFGIIICTDPLSQIVTTVVPRSYLSEVKNIKSIPNRGIYYLFNRTNNGIIEGYAGQTRKGVNRIIDHDSTKDWWNYAVTHFAPDENLSLDVVNALEVLSIKQLSESSFYCANKVGNLTKVGATELSLAQQIFLDIQFRMQALGFFI